MAIDDKKEKLIDESIKILQDIRTGNDLVFGESLRRRFLENMIEAGVLDATLTDINHTSTVGAGGGSVSHASSYAKRLRVTIDNVDYYIGLYLA